MESRSIARTALGLLSVLFAATLAWSQVPAPETTAVRAGKLFDPKSAEMLNNQVVLIQGEKITQVGPAASVTIPSGAKVFDLSRATVRPGLIDGHVHLTDAQGNLDIKQDYTIISRVANPRTGFITVTVAGLWGYGTLAAGRFLTDPQYIQEFSRRTGFNLDKSNLQIVIGTEVIQGKPGPPTVLAATSW